MTWKPDKSFGSVAKALDFILDQYCFRHRELLWFPGESGLLLPRDGPPFIFRGEPGGFETTVAPRNRPGTFEGLGQGDRMALDQLLSSLCKRLMLRYDYSLNEVHAKALLQHYGLPTELIDFTWRPAYAMAFAAKDNAEVGRICVMPIGQDAIPPALADLSDHKWAHRAQIQEGIGVVVPRGYEDLKSPRSQRRFSLTWIEFLISGPERDFLRKKYGELMGLANDPSSGFLRHHIIEYVEAKGKLSPTLTDWILKRIPMTPRCYKVHGFEGGDVIITNRPPIEFGPYEEEYEEELERDWTRRYLSSAYPNSSWGRMENWKWPPMETIVADPRTFHGLGRA